MWIYILYHSSASHSLSGYWSEKGDSKYCLKSPQNQFSWNQSYITFLTRIFSTYFPHQVISSLSLVPLSWFNFPTLCRHFLNLVIWGAIFLSWYTNKYRIGFFFFFCYQCFLLLFSCIDWSSSWEGFWEVCSQTQLCWESRSYCLVFPFIISTY